MIKKPLILTENTVVTSENAEAVIEAANAQIEKLKELYGAIPKRWKPIPVSHPHLYAKRAEAEKILQLRGGMLTTKAREGV